MKPNAKFINTEKIEGYVYSVGNKFNELSEKITGENSKNPGTKYISGDLDIAVDEAGLNVVTVHYTYVTETYGNGKTNNTYTTLKRILDNPDRMWINGGKDNAFKVSCTSVSIAINDFIANDESKVAAIRNEGGFCSIVSELCPENERNTFSVDMLITKVTHVEADPEKNINEDYATVSGCIFGYGKSIPTLLPVSFVVRNAGGVSHFEELDATPGEPVFKKVWGKINCMTIKTVKKEESAFGEAAVQTYERKSREYVITGASKIPYDFGDETILTKEDVVAMSQNRQIKLAEIEKRYKEAQASRKANNNAFNVKAAQTITQTVPDGNFVF